MEWIEKHPAWPAPLEVEQLRPADLAPGRHTLAVRLAQDAVGRSICAPVLVARGAAPGPVVGITAAVHGNELNGIPTIHHLFDTIDPAELRGVVVGVTIMNVPGFLLHQRAFPDGADLNRVMPGKQDGNESQQYAYRLKHRILDVFDVLIDLHTASFGRVNSLYVRADMTHAPAAEMARAVGAELIVHTEGGDGTLRGVVAARGCPAITVEIGDPQVIDRRKVLLSRIGIRDVIENLGLLDPDQQVAPKTPVECSRSYWLFTDAGGLLDVSAELTQKVSAGDEIAVLRDPFGRTLRTYRAPEDAVVVGRSTNPVANIGSRIVHLGIEG